VNLPGTSTTVLPTSSTVPSSTQSAPPAPDLTAASEAVRTLYAGVGMPGSRCFVQTSQSSVSFANCPVSSRLASRLGQVDGTGFFILYAGYNGPEPVTSVGQAAATASGATVRISVQPPPNGGSAFAGDALTVQSKGRWMVDELRFYGAWVINGGASSQFQPGLSGGPWSVYLSCFDRPDAGPC
jgi:hypothetical protein